MLRRFDWYSVIVVPKENNASIFSGPSSPRTTSLRAIRNYFPLTTVYLPRRSAPSTTLSEPQILIYLITPLRYPSFHRAPFNDVSTMRDDIWKSPLRTVHGSLSVWLFGVVVTYLNAKWKSRRCSLLQLWIRSYGRYSTGSDITHYLPNREGNKFRARQKHPQKVTHKCPCSSKETISYLTTDISDTESTIFSEIKAHFRYLCEAMVFVYMSCNELCKLLWRNAIPKQ
jgi:hypothetical protein